MKHSYREGCACNRCNREHFRRLMQSMADTQRYDLTRTRREEDRHARQMHKWAVAYDGLNGAPENDGDR